MKKAKKEMEVGKKREGRREKITGIELKRKKWETKRRKEKKKIR